MTTRTISQATRVQPAAASASAAALTVWIIATGLLNLHLRIHPAGGNPRVVGAGTVLVASLIASLLGWTALAILERCTTRARTVWTGAAVAVLLLSLAGPLSSRAAASTTAVLVLMHLAVAGVLIATLRRSSATR
jgi:hypothetical protein